MDCKVDLSGAVLPLKDSFPGATVGFLSRVNPVRYKKKSNWLQSKSVSAIPDSVLLNSKS